MGEGFGLCKGFCAQSDGLESEPGWEVWRSQFRVSRGGGSEAEGQVEPSSSCRSALSMLMRCPSLVTPSST